MRTTHRSEKANAERKQKRFRREQKERKASQEAQRKASQEAERRKEANRAGKVKTFIDGVSRILSDADPLREVLKTMRPNAAERKLILEALRDTAAMLTEIQICEKHLRYSCAECSRRT